MPATVTVPWLPRVARPCRRRAGAATRAKPSRPRKSSDARPLASPRRCCRRFAPPRGQRSAMIAFLNRSVLGFRAACAVRNVLKCRWLSGTRNFLLLGLGKLRIRCAGISADSTPRPAARTPRPAAAPGKKPDEVATGSIASGETRNTVGFTRNILFPGSCPTSGAWRRFSKRCRTRRCRRGERRGRDDCPVRAAGDHRRASARAVAGPGTQPQRALCGFSPPDCQDKPNDMLKDSTMGD